MHLLLLGAEAGSARLHRTPSQALSEGWLGPGLIAGDQVTFPTASGLTLRREVAERAFPLPERFRSLADGALRHRAALLAHTAASQAVLGDYRVHGRNLTGLCLFKTVGEIDSMMRGHSLVAQDLASFAQSVHGVAPDAVQFGTGERNTLLVHRSLLSGERTTREELGVRIGNPGKRAAWLALFAPPAPIRGALLRAKQTLAARSQRVGEIFGQTRAQQERP